MKMKRRVIISIGFLILSGCSTPNQVAEELIGQFNEDAVIVSNIGEPVNIGDLRHDYEGETVILKAQVLGEVDGIGDNRKARLIIPLAGPKGKVLVDVYARIRKGAWVILNLNIKDGGQYSGRYSEGIVSVADP